MKPDLLLKLILILTFILKKAFESLSHLILPTGYYKEEHRAPQ